ncbi:MAG: hypothetical protein COT90_00195 [Candidatus Diapherotrites archaeon CG10_big_fil_rev_8_21_14_0_10_31_34]|nr:MAG: hypothetical protein COT90_00195 [Candidatus Diapherotrites archaeon CG10_big_fil_rev_8_21_14_0_10_31_34]PJA20966.1 MAG: hypothetical protein COX63_00520 [Candidatus Diapherotrites archaeon CG_4_10_14_0_2_um_filter_31_5]
MKSKGQVSLELILVMSVFFSVLLLFIPLISKTFFLGSYVLDVSRAKSFSDSLEISVRELNSMSKDSKITLTANPLLEWKIKSEEQQTTITVLLKKYAKEKPFTSNTFNLIPFSELEITKKTVFVLTKTDKGVLAEIQKA